MNNPPAFPRTAGPYIESEGGCVNDSQLGMTLRDYAAIAAMQALLSRPTWNGSDEQTADLSYNQADAMLKARANEP